MNVSGRVKGDLSLTIHHAAAEASTQLKSLTEDSRNVTGDDHRDMAEKHNIHYFSASRSHPLTCCHLVVMFTENGKTF